MEHRRVLMDIIGELAENAEQVSEAEMERFTEVVLAGRRVFVAGAGRSGFAARAFANRLTHLGLTVYFVGEPTTPAIGAGDVLVIGSGSGETASLVQMAKKARAVGAALATLTINPRATIGSLADAVIRVPGTSPKNAGENTARSAQPMANAFEQMSWLIYDAVVIVMMGRLGRTPEAMFSRHANLE